MVRKVVHVITSLDDGGAEGVLTRLCLHSRRVDHVVISLMGNGKHGPVLISSGIVVHCLRMNPGRPGLAAFFRLVRLIRYEQPDIVQTWMYHADLLGGLAARLAGIKRIFWGVRHSTLERGKSKRLTIIIARLCALISPWLPEKIIYCASNAKEIHEGIGYDSKKSIVVPNGFDLNKFYPNLVGGQELRNELGIGIDEFVVGMVGRYHPQKDHLNLLKALKTLKLKGIKFRCLLVGHGLSLSNSAVVYIINDLDLGEEVILLGQRSDIPIVMNALNIHVLSSSYGEAFPNVVAEAMACGIPPIATDVGDSRLIIGNQGLVVPPKDCPALISALLAFFEEKANSPDAWLSRCAGCKREVSQRFSIQAMVSSFEAVWIN